MRGVDFRATRIGQKGQIAAVADMVDMIAGFAVQYGPAVALFAPTNVQTQPGQIDMSRK
jgi:hypothetical protein